MDKEVINMNNQKITLHAEAFSAEHDHNIINIARSKGIKIPSSHLALFKAVYATIDVPNRNGIILSRHAVENALPGLIGAQVNLEHFRRGFIVGFILDAWINAKNQIEIAFTFDKMIYAEEFVKAMNELEKGSLSVSFELLSDRSTQEFLENGNVLLNDVDFQGVGLLIESDPADPNANVFEMAKKYKQRAQECESKHFVYASEIKESFDKILESEDKTTIEFNLSTEQKDSIVKQVINELNIVSPQKSTQKGETKLMSKEKVKEEAKKVEEKTEITKEVKAEEIKKEVTEEKSELELAQDKIDELEAKVEELENTLSAKDSEIEAVRTNAETVGQRKVELKSNPYVVDFEDADYLDDAKIEDAKLKLENDQLKAENEALKNVKDKDTKKEVKAEEIKKEVKEEKKLEVGTVVEDDTLQISKILRNYKR